MPSSASDWDHLSGRYTYRDWGERAHISQQERGILAMYGIRIPERPPSPSQSTRVRVEAAVLPEFPPIRVAPGEAHGRIDVGALIPGEVHQISLSIQPTPQSILDGTYLYIGHQDCVMYVPRLPEHSPPPFVPTILFNANGMVGPYVRDIAKKKLQVDRAGDRVFEAHMWKKTHWMIDWPGVKGKREAIQCVSEKGESITRDEVAQIVCTGLVNFFRGARNVGKLDAIQTIDDTTRRWDLKAIDYRDVRIIGINYYKKTWIPVLAVSEYSTPDDDPQPTKAL